MGFQMQPGVSDVSASLDGGKDDPIYWQRTVAMICLQITCITIPVVILTYQLLVAFDKTRWLVPRCVRRTDGIQRQEWNDDLFRAIV